MDQGGGFLCKAPHSSLRSLCSRQTTILTSGAGNLQGARIVCWSAGIHIFTSLIVIVVILAERRTADGLLRQTLRLGRVKNMRGWSKAVRQLGPKYPVGY